MPIGLRKDVDGAAESNTLPVSTRVTREMKIAIDQFQEDSGYETASGALRALLAAGLESEVGDRPWLMSAHVEAGKHQALMRLDYCLTEMVIKFKSRAAIKGLDYNDIDE
jgi:hypothetical protein